MNEPVTLHKYIRLVTKKPLEKKMVNQWFCCVRDNGPSGIMGSHSLTDNEGMPQEVQLVYKKLGDGKNAYEIPLSRDLLDTEVETIFDIWDNLCPFDKFTIESSQDDIEKLDYDYDKGVVIDPADYNKLAEVIAKSNHYDWVKRRTEEGWRYGVKYSKVDKTHPMMLPWEQLPEKYKHIDFTAPEKFMQFMEKVGYVVVSKSEYDYMKKQMKQLETVTNLPGQIQESRKLKKNSKQ